MNKLSIRAFYQRFSSATAVFVMVAFALVSCSTEVDVLAPYKEIPIVYGLISSDDTVHIVKVNRSFSNQGRDARDIAANNPDSITYGTELDLWLVNLRSRDTSLFDSTTSIAKLPGLFLFPDQVTYRLNQTLNPNDRYIFIARNRATGVEASATTALVGDVVFAGTNITTLSFFRVPPSGGLVPRNQIFELRPSTNAFYYALEMRTNIVELYSDRDSVIKTYTAVINPGRVSVGNDNVAFTYAGESFVQFIASSIDPTKDAPTLTRRYLLDAQVEGFASTEEFQRYVSAATAVSAISQTKPFYTNVSGGAGLFTSRNSTTRNYLFDNLTTTGLRSFLPGYKF
jgi:hypothetical protein